MFAVTAVFTVLNVPGPPSTTKRTVGTCAIVDVSAEIVCREKGTSISTDRYNKKKDKSLNRLQKNKHSKSKKHLETARGRTPQNTCNQMSQ